MTSFLRPPQHLTKTLSLINIIYPVPSIWRFFSISCFSLFLFAFGVVADVCCFFHLGLLLITFFAHACYLLRGIFSFDLVTHTLPHPPTLQGFCADAHRFTQKCWWVVGGVGWITFRVSPYESEFILVSQVRAIICCLLILFITQSGSCTLGPPRLLICCFPLHRRQNPVGHNAFRSFVNRHKNSKFKRTT